MHSDGDQSHLKLTPVAKGTYETDVNCLTNFENGFCYAQYNQLFVFEKEKSYVRYKRRAKIKIPIRLYAADSYKITNVSVNSQMDTVIATTFHSQIYISKLFDPEMVTLQHLEFVMLGEPLHIASIVSMSICSWKPIIMTACNSPLFLSFPSEMSFEIISHLSPLQPKIERSEFGTMKRPK